MREKNLFPKFFLFISFQVFLLPIFFVVRWRDGQEPITRSHRHSLLSIDFQSIFASTHTHPHPHLLHTSEKSHEKTVRFFLVQHIPEVVIDQFSSPHHYSINPTYHFSIIRRRLSITSVVVPPIQQQQQQHSLPMATTTTGITTITLSFFPHILRVFVRVSDFFMFCCSSLSTPRDGIKSL